MTHLYRTQTTGNRRTFTISTWIKFGGNYGQHGAIILNTDGDNTNRNFMYGLKTDDTISLHLYGGDVFTTTRKIRDHSSWYHIVLGIDTTQATAGNRVKFYINGELQSITQESLYPAQNFDFGVGDNGRVMSIMGDHDNSNNYDNRSYLSHYHFCDGYQYAASDFGSTDSVTGEWNINTSPNVNYGSTGFFLKFENSSNLVEDSGGNSISFSTSGTPIPTLDNPSNNFAVFNSHFKAGAGTTTFSHGNLTGQSPNSQGSAGVSSLGARSGKWYAEFKQSAESTSNEGAIAVVDSHYINQNLGLSSSGYLEYCVACWGLRDHSSGGTFYSSGGSRSTGSSQHQGWSNGDILMVAMDVDNNRVYFGKNGQWNDSNTWSSATPSQYLTLDATDFEGEYHFAVGDSSSGNNVTWQANFGNGYFGTTAVTSAQNPADGIGIFEYTVPTGYKALCTKGLNS